MGFVHYLINVPPDWNAGLVLFAHGYEGEGSGTGTARSEPLDTHLTRRAPQAMTCSAMSRDSASVGRL